MYVLSDLLYFVIVGNKKSIHKTILKKLMVIKYRGVLFFNLVTILLRKIEKIDSKNKKK